MMLEASTKSNKDSFVSWLSEKVLSQRVDTILSTVEDIDLFCKKHNVISKTFFEIDDAFELAKVSKAIDENRLFKLTHKDKISIITEVISYYNSFLKAMGVKSNYGEVNYIEIKYSSSKDINSAKFIRMPQMWNNNRTVFLNWMVEVDKTAQSTATNYSSAVKTISEYGMQWGLLDDTLFNISDTELISDTIKAFGKDVRFVSLNTKQHNRYSAALNKYYVYASRAVSTMTSNNNSIKSNKNIHKYEFLLTTRFEKGFRLSSSLETKRLRSFYEDQFATVAVESDEEIQQIMKSIGIVHKERVYSPKSMLDNEIKKNVFEHIARLFSDGKAMIHYDTIYAKFEDNFHRSTIYNADMLKCYLEYFSEGQFFVKDGYLVKTKNADVDLVDEVRRFMKTHGTIASYDDIEEHLTHIPLEEVKRIFTTNDEFIWVSRECYIHIECVYFSGNDLDNIRNILTDIIEKDGFVSGNELKTRIETLYPEIIEINATIANFIAGLRDSIKYHLSGYFNFKGNIISKLGTHLSMADVYAEYCKRHETFSLDELNVLAKELGSVIYFNAVYDNSLRINKNDFVQKNRASFNISLIDDAIKLFCGDDYIPITAIKQFLLFPGTAFPWDPYLLEHYVYVYSAEFKLVDPSFCATKCVGVIVKRTSQFNTFEQVITDVLAKSNITLNKEIALNYLYDNGYIGKRSLSCIENVIATAVLNSGRKG